MRRLVAAACLVMGRVGLARAQSVDPTFNPGAHVNTPATVRSTVVQPDGKILFTSFNNGDDVARVHADGSLDSSFDYTPGLVDNLEALALQSDGKILVGGISVFGSRTLGRLNADGSIDLTYNPGANGEVWRLLVQADGKTLVGGNFSRMGGTERNKIARFNMDGTLDTGFNPQLSSSSSVYVSAIAIQSDGKILIGGYFTQVSGQPRNHIARLNADGSLDTTFMNAGTSGAFPDVYTLALQPDGKVLAGGYFTGLGGGTGTTTRHHIGRLNSDGSLDDTFDVGANDIVWEIVFQPDGKALVIGNFTMVGGGGTGTTPRNRIARLIGLGSAPPTIASISNTTTPQNTQVVINVTVGDSDSGPDAVSVSASSSSTLVSSANLVFGGSGANRTLTITPTTNDFGTTTITVTASDGVLTATSSFVLRVYLPFTDNVLTAGATQIRAVHITELRSRIAEVRSARNLPTFSWTDPALSAGGTLVRREHLLELRTALNEAYAASGLTPPTYTDATIAAGSIQVKAVHIAELRSAVVNVQ